MDKIFTVNNVLNILMRRLWLIVAMIFIGGTVAYTYSEYVLPKKYSSSVTLYVYNQAEGRQQINASDLSFSQRLVDTYMVILKSDYVLEKVSEKIKEENLNYTADTIKGMITSEAVNGTEVFRISVSSFDKEHSKIIADTIAEIAPDEIIRVVKAGAVEIVDSAKMPTTYTSPNIPRNTIIGIILGLIFACAFSILLELMNTSVKSREDLAENHKLPVLAVIPNLDGRDTRSYSYRKKNSKYYYYSYYYDYGYGTKKPNTATEVKGND